MPAWDLTLVISVFTSEKLVSVAWDLGLCMYVHVIVQPIICLTQCSAGTKIDRLELAP